MELRSIHYYCCILWAILHSDNFATDTGIRSHPITAHRWASHLRVPYFYETPGVQSRSRPLAVTYPNTTNQQRQWSRPFEKRCLVCLLSCWLDLPHLRQEHLFIVFIAFILAGVSSCCTFKEWWCDSPKGVVIGSAHSAIYQCMDKRANNHRFIGNNASQARALIAVHWSHTWHACTNDVGRISGLPYRQCRPMQELGFYSFSIRSMITRMALCWYNFHL